MNSPFKTPITAEQVKEKGRQLGADLVGIADGQALDANPPDPGRPRRPSDITDFDGGRVIVLARRLNAGATRLLKWNERHKYYNDEIGISMLEEAALELVLWLEQQGYPALIVPPTHVDPWLYNEDPGEHLAPLLSAEHAAVEAGLGTLGLNGQLLTPEFGPRVLLSLVLCSADIAADNRQEEALCPGPSCGRCLSACPGDVIGHWVRDWVGCDRYRSPHGFQQVTDFLGAVLDESDVDVQKQMVRSETSFDIWQSTLRGAGVMTGCRRCKDVCPVGKDYALLRDVVETIPEESSEKRARLATMVAAEEQGSYPEGYRQQARWIGRPAD